MTMTRESITVAIPLLLASITVPAVAQDAGNPAGIRDRPVEYSPYPPKGDR